MPVVVINKVLECIWPGKIVGINQGWGANKNYLVDRLIPHVVYQNDSPTTTAILTALFGLGFDMRFFIPNIIIWPQLQIYFLKNNKREAK